MNANSGISLATSKIISTFNIDKPSVRNELFRRLGKQGLTFFGFIESLGYSRPVHQNQTTQYEEDWIHQTIHVGVGGITTVDAPNGIYSFLLSVAAGTNDLLAGSIVAPYPTTATNPLSYIVPCQAWDRIYFPENNAIGTITSVTQTGVTTTFTVTFKLAQLTKSITVANYTAGTELVIGTNAFTEGSDQPNGQNSKPLIDYNYTQILKQNFKWTGTQATNEPWFNLYEGHPDLGDGYYIKGQEDCEYELQAKISTAFWIETPTTNPTVDPATGEPLTTTEGLIPYVDRLGNPVPYTTGAFSVGVFDYADNILSRQFAPPYVCCMNGISLDQQITSVLKAYFQFTQINYTMDQMEADLFSGDKELAMQVGFNLIKMSDRYYCFTRAMEFNHPKLLGATGYSTPAIGVWFPMAKKRDAKEEVFLPYMGCIYKANKSGSYNRKAEVWTITGAGPGMKITSLDLNNLCMRSNLGAEHVGGNQMIKVYPV